MKSFVDQVRDWAATKPTDEAYDYEDFRNCALCQFLSDNGYAKTPRVISGYWRDGVDGRWIAHYDSENKLEDALCSEPSTFGALAERLSA